MKKRASSFLLSCLFLSGFAFALQPGDFRTSGPSAKKRIALSFDDGPGPNTPQFLDLLDKYKVKATFFMLSEQVKIRPALAKTIHAKGHEIGNHTTQHLNYKAELKKAKAADPVNGAAKAQRELVADMKNSRAVIEKVIGEKLVYLRMPHGIDGDWVHAAAKEAGFVLVNWTYGMDWNSSPAEKLIPGYLKAIQPGAIILLHDGWPKSQKSLEITEAVLKSAQEKGYEIVPVGQLLTEK